jgi:hypothetical protein
MGGLRRGVRGGTVAICSMKGIPMLKTQQSSPIEIPEDIAALAAEQGVTAELPAVIEMTRRIFPGCPMHLEYDIDPEIANDRHIAIVVKATHFSVDEAVRRDFQWHREIFANCPAPLVCVFRLGLEIGP